MWIFRREVRSRNPEVRSRTRGPGIGSRNTGFGPSFEFRFSNFEFRLLAAAVCLLFSASLLLALGGRYTVTEVKPHVFVWVPEEIHDIDGDPNFTLAGTAGFIIGPDGVIVINTANNPYHGREILYEIRQRTDLPVKYVINTDSRGDHILGNEVFTDQHAVMISTPFAAIAMSDYKHDLTGRLSVGGEEGLRLRQRMRGIHVTLPTQEINKDSTIGVGGEEVRLLLPMAGPAPGSLVVYLPRSKVLFLGDLWQNGTPRRPKEVDLAKWVEYLRKVETWDVNVYVPGEGPPGDKRDVEKFCKWLEGMEKSPAPKSDQ